MIIPEKLNVPAKRIASVPVKVGEIKYSGVFDYDKLYKGVHDWFSKRKYDFQESTYKHKPGKAGPEIEISFKGERKETGWIMYKISVDFHIWDLTDVEVTKEGKKQKLNKGRMTILLQMEVVFDYEKRFEDKPFYIRLYNLIVDKVMYLRLMMGPVDSLYYETTNLQTEIKLLLDMETAYSAYP